MRKNYKIKVVLVLSLTFLSFNGFSQLESQNLDQGIYNSQFNQQIEYLKKIIADYILIYNVQNKTENDYIQLKDKSRNIRVYIGDVILIKSLNKEEYILLSDIVNSFDEKLSKKFLVLAKELSNK